MASVFQILMWMIKTCSFCNFVTVFTTKRLYMCLVFLWCLCHACLDSLTARSPFSCFVNRPCILCGVKNKKLVAHFLLPPPPLHMLLWQGVLWVRLGARWGANRGPVREITRGLFYRTLHQTDAAVTGDSCVGVDVGAGRIQSVGFFFPGSENTRHNLHSPVICGRECSCQRPVSSRSVCHTVLQQLHHQVSLNWPPQNVCSLTKGEHLKQEIPITSNWRMSLSATSLRSLSSY